MPGRHSHLIAEGRATLAAVRFEIDPPPDFVGPVSPASGAIETPKA